VPIDGGVYKGGGGKKGWGKTIPVEKKAVGSRERLGLRRKEKSKGRHGQQGRGKRPSCGQTAVRAGDHNGKKMPKRTRELEVTVPGFEERGRPIRGT